MKNAQSRYENSQATNDIRFHGEAMYADILKKKCGEIFLGQYVILLTSPSQMTHRLLNKFLANGQVLLYPDNAAEYADLHMYCAEDGAINLSTVYLASDVPEGVTPEAWAVYREMLKQVFKVLRSDCISPMQRMVADIQRSFGYGAPKISKKFGGDVDPLNTPEGDVVKLMESIAEAMKTERASIP